MRFKPSEMKINIYKKMVIPVDLPLANDHPDGPASCKWSSGGASLLQTITMRDQPHANDHPDEPASCKWSSGGASLLQIISWRDQPLANDHPDEPASYKWLSRGTGLLVLIFRINHFILHVSFYLLFFPTNIILSFKTFLLLLQFLGSRFNLTDLSRTLCSWF